MAKKNPLTSLLVMLRKHYEFTVKLSVDEDFIYFTDSTVTIKANDHGRGGVTLQLGNMVRHHRMPTYILASLDMMRGIEAKLRIPTSHNPGTRREAMRDTYLQAVREIPGYEKVKARIDLKRNPGDDIVIDFTYDGRALFRIDVGLFSSDTTRTCNIGAESAVFFCNNRMTEFDNLEDLIALLRDPRPALETPDYVQDGKHVCFLADSHFASTFIHLTSRGWRDFKAHKVIVEGRVTSKESVIQKFLNSDTEHTVYVGESTDDF